MDQPRSIAVEQRVGVLDVPMTTEEYRHLERSLENILAGLHRIIEQQLVIIERLDRILSKPERLDRAETK
jgi:hypothetical protein